MRGLSDTFLIELKDGFLKGLRNKVVEDKDLDLQIRENYINIYYKGNSLLKLSAKVNKYKVEIHKKFAGDLIIPKELTDEGTTGAFISQIPFIKENIIKYGNSSIEIEYEQMIIRANNSESRNNSEYFIVDRQYTVEKEGRFDLTGFYWSNIGRRKEQKVPLCFVEIKYALNNDIKDVHEQMLRYYEALNTNHVKISEEAEYIFKQKLELGLLNQEKERVEALKTLSFTSDIKEFQFILALVDFNPNSKLFDIGKLKSLPFANQIKIFEGGFGMWKQNMKNL